MFDQGDRSLPRAAVALAIALIVGTIVSVTWLGMLGFAVGGMTAILYLTGHALGAGNFFWGAFGGDKLDAMRSELARERFAQTDAEEFDEAAWERARARRRAAR